MRVLNEDDHRLALPYFMLLVSREASRAKADSLLWVGWSQRTVHCPESTLLLMQISVEPQRVSQNFQNVLEGPFLILLKVCDPKQANEVEDNFK